MNPLFGPFGVASGWERGFAQPKILSTNLESGEPTFIYPSFEFSLSANELRRADVSHWPSVQHSCADTVD